MENTTPIRKGPDELEILRKVLFKTLKSWYFIVLSLGVALGVAFLVNRYTTPIYGSSAQIFKRDTREASEFLTGAGGAARGGFRNANNLNNEIVLLRSSGLIEELVKELNWEVSYWLDGSVRTSELYKASPFLVDYSQSDNLVPYGTRFQINLLNPEQFVLETEREPYKSAFAGRTFKFGEELNIEGFQFVVYLINREQWESYGRDKLSWQPDSPAQLARAALGRMDVAQLDLDASALTISMVGPNPAKDIDFLNKYMQAFVENNLREKNKAAENTIAFINKQLASFADSLSGSEGRIEQFNVNRNTISISQDASLVYEKLQEVREQRLELRLQNEYYDYLLEYLNEESSELIEEPIAPSSVGIEDQIATSLLTQLISINSDLNRFKSFQDVNIIAQGRREDLIRDFERTKRQLLENIRNSKKRIDSREAMLKRQEDEFVSEIKLIPGAEAEFKGIEREFRVNENVYLMFLNRRMDLEIQKESNESDYKILEPARGGAKLAPNDERNYAIAGAIGAAIPFIIIFLLDFFNNKIISLEDFRAISEIPFLGMIGHSDVETNLIVLEKPKSSVTEAFRVIRSNIQFMLDDDQTSKVILVTSTVSGEGKTFSAMNIASIIAISGKRTVILGADMRKPNVYNKNFAMDAQKGLSN